MSGPVLGILYGTKWYSQDHNTPWRPALGSSPFTDGRTEAEQGYTHSVLLQRTCVPT